MADFLSHPEPSRRTWMVSLWFWLCLLFAAGLYAVVALTPGWAAHLNLRDKYDRNQRTLVALEQRTGYLRQVIDALETDPHFAAELARVDFDAARPGDERIPVGPDLVLHSPPPQPATVISVKYRSWPRWFLETGSHNRIVRSVILGFSALLVLFAFAALPNPYHPSSPPVISTGWSTWLKHRYTLRGEGESKANSPADTEG